MENTQNNTPMYDVFHALKTESGETDWQKIGAAWKNTEEEGLTIRLKEMPETMELIFFEPFQEKVQSKV